MSLACVQPSLFDGEEAMAGWHQARFRPGFEAWQACARRLLAAQHPPDSIWWREDPLAAIDDARAGGASGRVPRRFLDLARPVSHHRASARWALLYRVLWRLTHGEPHLMQLAADPDVQQLERWSQAVRRDAHKMKAFVRFRLMPAAEGDARYVAWFEPSHHSLTYTAEFFRRRFANMAWSILTPDCCAHHDPHGAVWFTEGVTREQAAPDDAFEQAWRLYYRSIFNPARVKLAAMRAEMPVKYWKNLPEAQDIALLIREADPRVAAMQVMAPAEPVMRCGAAPESPARVLARALQEATPGSPERLALAVTACQRCALWESATAAVPGHGNPRARLMLVGEQPGDQEDLAGRPFVGPAGRVLRRAMQAAGIAEASVWMTNTVKHFRFKVSNRRRLHQRPEQTHIKACLPFLREEIALIDPAVIVCLGTTAAQALIGSQVRVLRDRGRFVSQDGRRYLATVHPSWLLRNPDIAGDRDEFQRFVADLALAAEAAG